MSNFNETAAVGENSTIITTVQTDLDKTVAELDAVKAAYASDTSAYHLKVYAHLAKCWSISNRITGNKNLRIAFNNLCDKENIAAQKSNLLTKVVRWVLGKDSKQASPYVKLIKAADKDGVLPSGLSDWAIANGGIAGVNRKKTLEKPKVTSNQLENAATKAIYKPAKPITTIKHSVPGASKAGAYVVGFFKVGNAGELELMVLSANDEIVGAAVQALGKQELSSESSAEQNSQDPEQIIKSDLASA